MTGEIFFFKHFAENEARRQAVRSLVQYVSIALNLAYNKNKPYKTLDYWSRDMLNFNFSENVAGLVSPSHFVHYFLRNVTHAIFFELTKLHCLIIFTSWDIGQYMYYDSLLTRLWCHEIWNLPSLTQSTQSTVLLQEQKVNTKI